MKPIKEHSIKNKIRLLMSGAEPLPDAIDPILELQDRVEKMARRVSNRIYHMIIEESKALYK